jgi:CPA2 family monovalent cation:H+ antiporter-2
VKLGRRPRLRYGPTGRTLTRLLKDHDVEPTVIELNADTTRRLRDEGVRAVDGDAAYRATLEAVRVLTRTSHLRQLDALRRAGAETVFSGAGEVALALTEAISAGSARRAIKSTANAPECTLNSRS